MATGTVATGTGCSGSPATIRGTDKAASWLSARPTAHNLATPAAAWSRGEATPVPPIGVVAIAANHDRAFRTASGAVARARPAPDRPVADRPAAESAGLQSRDRHKKQIHEHRIENTPRRAEGCLSSGPETPESRLR